MSDINGAEAPSDTFTPEERAHLSQETPETQEASPEAQEAPQRAEKSPPEQPQEDRKVNYGALAEERGRRRQAEERARNSEIMQARMEERFRAWQAANQPRPEPPPDPDADPFAAVKYHNQQLANINGKIAAYERHEAGRQQQEANRQRAAQQWDAVTSYTKGQEEQFRAKNPDYDDAVQYLLNSRANELKFMGANDLQIGETIRRESQQMAIQAAQLGKNTGEMVYEFAKSRGYKKADKGGDLQEKMDVIEAGQQASKSLSSVGGKAGGGEVTLRDLASMSDDDFAAYKAKNPVKYRRLLGASQ